MSTRDGFTDAHGVTWVRGDYAAGGTIPPHEPTADEIPAFLSPCGCARLQAPFPMPQPAPTDTSWITFEPAQRSLWARIRRLWHRDGITKREADDIRQAFLDAQGTPPTVLADDTIQFKDVARLDLKPGDTLVVTLREPVTTQMTTTVRDRILAILGDQIDEHHLLVIPETAEFSVLRTDGQPLAQWELELLARQDPAEAHGDQP